MAVDMNEVTTLNALDKFAAKVDDKLKSMNNTKSDDTTLKYKGEVETYSNLPESASKGDMYKIKQAGTNNNAGDFAIYNGTSWEIMNGHIDTGNLLTKDDIWLE